MNLNNLDPISTTRTSISNDGGGQNAIYWPLSLRSHLGQVRSTLIKQRVKMSKSWFFLSGSNGKVKLGYHKHTGYKVAIKIIDKETLEGNKDRKRKMEREIAILVRN